MEFRPNPRTQSEPVMIPAALNRTVSQEKSSPPYPVFVRECQPTVPSLQSDTTQMHVVSSTLQTRMATSSPVNQPQTSVNYVISSPSSGWTQFHAHAASPVDIVYARVVSPNRKLSSFHMDTVSPIKTAGAVVDFFPPTAVTSPYNVTHGNYASHSVPSVNTSGVGSSFLPHAPVSSPGTVARSNHVGYGVPQTSLCSGMKLPVSHLARETSAIMIHLHLLSGLAQAIASPLNGTIRDLRIQVEIALGTPISKLLSAAGHEVIEAHTIQQAGLHDQSVVTCIAGEHQIGATYAVSFPPR